MKMAKEKRDRSVSEENIYRLDGLVDTPNFDRIAREGVLFMNAHVPAPSSTPWPP